jgi:hypothetical protein
MTLVILGATDLSKKFVTAICVPLVVCQDYTLFAIKSALQTITP